MRSILFLLVLLTARLCRAGGPFDHPVLGPQGEFTATFAKVYYPQAQREGTQVTVRARRGELVCAQELSTAVASNAEWTPDGKFLVVTALNGGGHSPWRSLVFVCSPQAGEWRRYEEPAGTPVIVSPQMSFQSPHTVLLLGHTFEHHLSPPADPVTLRLDLAGLWAKLEKV